MSIKVRAIEPGVDPFPALRKVGEEFYWPDSHAIPHWVVVIEGHEFQPEERKRPRGRPKAVKNDVEPQADTDDLV